MKKKKSSFLAFMASLVPGAGEMYIGFMKRGLSIMLIFWGLIFVSVWVNISSLLFGIPIIWFYSFFDVHNLRSMPDDMLSATEDDYILFTEFNTNKTRILQQKYRNILAWILIIIGVSVLWNNMNDFFYELLPNYFGDVIRVIGHYFPQLLIGFAIIAFGLYLIRGKKKELDMGENLNLSGEEGGKTE